MNKFKITPIAAILLIMIALPACFPEDKQVDPPTATNGNVALGDDYASVVYYNLKTGKSVKTNQKTDWDFGFACHDSLTPIVLNTARFMKAANTGLATVADISATSSLNFLFDASSGNADTTAFGGWNAVGATAKNAWLKKLFVIDMGLDLQGNSLGFARLYIDSVNTTTWYIKAAVGLTGNMQAYSINKDNSFNYTGFNLTTKLQVNYEPTRYDYDLYFGSYSTLLFTEQGAPYPYLLTGVLCNPHNCVAKMLNNVAFEDITLSYAQSLSFSGKHDDIGYDWKTYSFDLGSYSIIPNRVYVIRTADNVYFALRFIGFLNDQGKKGYPRFEYKPL